MSNDNRITRKLKQVLDENLKFKYRYSSLESIHGIIITYNLESLSELEQFKLYQENSEAMIKFVVESFNHTLEKLSINKDYRDRFERALNKDPEIEFKTLPLFKKMLRFLGGKLVNSDQCENIVNIIRVLLHPQNHPALRREGMWLMMNWLKDESNANLDVQTLFASCIPLKLLFLAEEDGDGGGSGGGEGGNYFFIDQPEFPLNIETEPPLCIYLTDEPETVALKSFEDFLSLFTNDPNADKCSVMILFGLFKKYYLERLFPLIEGESEKSFALCPISIEVLLVRYLSKWITRDYSSMATVTSTPVPVAALILGEVLLQSEQDVDFIHEILRQALILPFSYHHEIKMAINIIRSWTFQPKDRRPEFMHDLHHYLQQYINMLVLLFDGRSAVNCNEEQSELFREAFYFYRGLSIEAYFHLTEEDWRSILAALILIGDRTLTLSNKYEIISNPNLASSFAQLWTETLMGILIKSRFVNQEAWEAVSTVISRATSWIEVIQEWSRTILDLTGILIYSIYAIKPDIEEAERQKSTELNQKDIRLVCTIKGETNAALRHLGLFPCPTERQLSRNDNFCSWPDHPWTRQNICFLWRNTLRLLGDVNEISNPEVHELAIKTLAILIERLIEVRAIQDYYAKSLPPIFEVARIFFDCIDLNPRQYQHGRCIAIAILGRLFCRNRDQGFGLVGPAREVFARFYLAIINSLADKDDPVAITTLQFISSIFGYNLPGSFILISSIIRCSVGILNGRLREDSKAVVIPILRLMTNISVIGNIYDQMAVPRIEAPLAVLTATPVSVAGELGMKDIKWQILDIVRMTDGQEIVTSDPNVHSQLVFTASILLINELMAVKNVNWSLVDGYLGILLEHFSPKDSPLLPNVFDPFILLVQNYPLIKDKLGEDRTFSITQRMIQSMRSFLSSVDVFEGEKDELAGRLIHCLLDWLLALSPDWLSKHQTLKDQLFSGIEEALQKATGSNSFSRLTMATSSMHLPLPSNLGMNAAAIASSSNNAAINASALSPSNSLSSGKKKYESSSNSPVSNFSLTAEAAEFFLIQMMHQFDNWAPELGANCLSSIVEERDSDKIIYFAYGNGVIIGIQQYPASLFKSQCRLILRNASGRFSWDTMQFWEDLAFRDQDCYTKPEVWNQLNILPNVPLSKVVAEVEPFISKEDLIVPKERNSLEFPIVNHKVDLLKEFLDYIVEEFPETKAHSQMISSNISSMNMDSINFPSSHPSNSHSNSPSPSLTALEDMRIKAIEQTEKELIISREYERISHQMTPSPQEDIKLIHSICRPDKSYQFPPAPFQYCRQLLASLGFLSPSLINNGMYALNISRSDLDHLDSINCREIMNISLYSSDKNSEDYREFTKTLGWKLKKGDGFLYYCTPLLEAYFYYKDSGHYPIQIVWNESVNDYTSFFSPSIAGLNVAFNSNSNSNSTFNSSSTAFNSNSNSSSSSNSISIIITPINGIGFYRLNYLIPVDCPFTFGPIIDGLMVSRALLGPIVKASCISAHRLWQKCFGGIENAKFRHPYWRRAREIETIMNKHAQREWSMEQFAKHVFFHQFNKPEPLSMGGLGGSGGGGEMERIGEGGTIKRGSSSRTFDQKTFENGSNSPSFREGQDENEEIEKEDSLKDQGLLYEIPVESVESLLQSSLTMTESGDVDDNRDEIDSSSGTS